jgi:hypothetical protein
MGKMQMISKQWTQFLHRNLQFFTWDLYGLSSLYITARHRSHEKMFAKLSQLHSLHLFVGSDHLFINIPRQVTAALVHKTTLTSLTFTNCVCDSREGGHLTSLSNLTSLTFDKMKQNGSAGLSVICGIALPKLLTLSIKDVEVLRYFPLGQVIHYGQNIAKNFTSLKNLELINTDLLCEDERNELAKSCNVTYNGLKV